jgi:hypothetical protein
MGPLNTAWTSGNGLGGTTGGTGGTGGTPGQVSGTYLKKLTTSDQAAQQSFISSCQSPDKLFNSCSTTDSVTGQSNCQTTTLECQKHSPKDFVWIGWYNNSLTLKGFIEMFTTTTLHPAVSAEVSQAAQFISGCTNDGGVVCTTDGNAWFETPGILGGGNISCPASDQQASYSVPAQDTTFCEKSLNMFCMDPNNSNNGCNSYWKFSGS